MDSDEEELAQLRAARAARTGGPNLSLAALREQQRKAQEAEASREQGVLNRPDDADDSKPGPAPPARTGKGRKEPEVELVDADAQLMEEDSLRQHFPMSFGEKPRSASSAADDFHAQTRRNQASFGPPRPPAVGPPKPPAVGPPRPTSDGAAAAAAAADEQPAGPRRPPADGEEEEQEQVGPPRPPPTSGDGEDDAGDVQESDDQEAYVDPYNLPISHEVVLGSSHSKAVTCMDIDHTGSRLVTGSMDYTLRIYDFNGMKRDMKAFREFEPQEGHPVLSVTWSPTGDAFLVVTGSSQAKIYDRDGLTRGEFVRGDMYIRDMRNTKGHVSGLLGGCWHPTDRYTAMTCSDDGTVRIWDTHNIEQKTVIKPTLAKPVRTAVTACSYGLDGKLIAAGLMDGSIQLWNVSGKFGSSAAVGQVMPPKPQMIEKQNWTYVSRAGQLVRTGHTPETEISCLTFSQDGQTLLSRGLDATLKLWDLRKFTQPVRVWDDLPCSYPTTKCIFSPDEQLILTCVNQGGSQEGGAVVVLDKSKQEVVRKIGVPGQAASLAWHHRLNQIFIGLGDRKSGSCRVLYDPEQSQRGVLMGAARAPRKPSPFDVTPEMMARAVYEQPIYRRERLTGKKRREQMAQDAIKHHKPDPGMAAGMGKQGRIGTTSKTLLTQHLLKKKGGLMAPELEADPREALLRHADKKDVFSGFTDAYKATQPVPIFAQDDDDEEEEGDA